ncbi:MAG: hypothetical protein GY838_17790 [bacterium]|nr:hypothetical protein [bacterium]
MNSFAPMPTGKPRHGLKPVLMLLVAVVAFSLIAGCGDDEADPTFPKNPPPDPDPWFFDVQGTAANDVWVAGNVGIMYHFDGTDWTLTDLGSDNAVTKIHVEDLNTLYACGHGGKIWRNTGGGWSSMDSGTNDNLYGLGSFFGTLHAVGHSGTIRRLGGSSWGGVASGMVIRDPTRDDAAIDTLSLTQDVASLTTVNHYFIGGAYRLPNFTGDYTGQYGTDGMVLGEDSYFNPAERFDWLLRPVRGSDVSNISGYYPEWINCSTSDELNLANNYLGTDQGWLFQLGEDLSGDRVWTKNDYRVTTTESEGIRDMWVNTDGNLYLVTSEGQVLRQLADGTREVLYDQQAAITGIWGTAPDNLYLVGYMNEMILHAVHDTMAGTFTVQQISLPFPDNKRLVERSAFDELGRPRR